MRFRFLHLSLETVVFLAALFRALEARCSSRLGRLEASVAMWVEAGADGIHGHNVLAKSEWIATKLYETCVLPDDGLRLRKTGSISPSTSLKTRACKDAFRWAGDVGGKRFFTLKACRLAVAKLLQLPGVEVPLVGGLTRAAWVEQQAKYVLYFSQRARKNSLAVQRARSESSQDGGGAKHVGLIFL